MRDRIVRNGIIAGTALVLATALVMTVPAHVSAQRGPWGSGGFGGGGRGGMLRQLDLTDAQRDQVRSVREQHRDAALAEQLKAAREALDEAVTVEVVNESTIRGLAANVALLEAEALVQRTHANAAMLQVLTPDQRAELRQLQAEARERFGERMRQRRERR